MCETALAICCLASCGGGGGGGVAPAQNVPQTGTGGVDGYVYAAVGSAPAARAAEAAPPAGLMPLTGARVEAECGIYTHITNTNAEGYFKISNIATGNCELRVSKSGYATRTYPVTVTANVTTRLGGTEGAKLSPAQSGEITVTTNVSGAEVTIDGVSTGLTIPETLSRVFTDISARAHEVGVSKAGYAASAAKTVNVTAGNNALVEFVMAPANATPPVANAGADAKTFTATRYVYDSAVKDYDAFENAYTLDGSGSYSTWGGEITYQWTQTGGTAVELRDATTARPSFIPQGNDTYVFSLVVRDAAGNYSAPDYVQVESMRPSGKLAYAAYKGGYHENIYTMNADGTEFKQLTDNNHSDGGPRWSPDGNKIMFTTNPSRDEATYYIATMNANGTGVNILGVEGGSRAWSPDGNKLLITSKYLGVYEFYEMNPDGSNLTRISNTGKSKQTANYSPDGTQIVFAQELGYSTLEIYKINSDGTGLTKLTNNGKINLHPEWLVDGRILFTYNEDWTWETDLFVMNADGTGAQAWPTPVGVDNVIGPVMTNDGQFIFYTGYDHNIYVMYADGSAVLNLGVGASNIDYHPGP